MPDKRGGLRLVYLPVSPWSERARWALDHHQLAYQPIVHTPFLGERRLRKLVGPDQPRATVPVLLTGTHTITDSWDIALYADREGHGTRLIPEAREAEVQKWNQLSSDTMAAGRALVAGALLASGGALDETLPPSVPWFIRRAMRPMSRHGTRWFIKKYDLDPGNPRHIAQYQKALAALRSAVNVSAPYLLGSFSYADIAMAVTLQAIAPVPDHYIPLGPATRKTWQQPLLAADYPDVLAWRDLIYERHRKPAPR